MKHKQPMPSYYGKNIAQHAQRRFFQRKAREREARERAGRVPEAMEGRALYGTAETAACGRVENDSQ